MPEKNLDLGYLFVLHASSLSERYFGGMEKAWVKKRWADGADIAFFSFFCFFMEVCPPRS